MNRRLCRKWVVWLLPLLAVRAFLPVGFMWSAGPGGPELGFCPGRGSAFVATTASHAHHADHATQHQHGNGSGGERADSPCPFGIAAVALSGDVEHFAAALPEPGPAALAPRSLEFSTAGPVRADRIRGPPWLT